MTHPTPFPWPWVFQVLAVAVGTWVVVQLPALLTNLRGWLGALARLDGEWAIPAPAVEGLDRIGLAV